MAVILVTGANQGLGYALLHRLGKETTGNTLLLGARTATKGEDAVKSLAKDGVEAEFVLIDVTDDKTIEAAAKTVEEKYGKLDVLVNNAGISRTDKPTIREAMHAVFDTNVCAIPVILDAFKSLLVKSDVKKVINVSSTMGSLGVSSKTPYPFPLSVLVTYPPSKSALNMVTLQYSLQWADLGVKFMVICPGYVSTNMNDYRGVKTPYDGVEAQFTAITTDDWESGQFYQKEPGQDKLTPIAW